MARLFQTVMKTGTLLSALLDAFPQYSKDRLFSFVLCGNVEVNEERVKDHTRIIKQDCTLCLTDEEIKDTDFEEGIGMPTPRKYVSRGGNKLAPVLSLLDVGVQHKVWLDCGASTGGFTQCLLEFGAEFVHAVDVAHNFLDYKLRVDSRVLVHEKTNVMSLDSLEPVPERAVADISFRSLRKIAAHIVSLCEDEYLLALCKPQFEYAHSLNKGETAPDEHFDGILEDMEIVKDVIFQLIKDLFEEGLVVLNIVPAGVRGGGGKSKCGNQEYFLEIVSLRVAKGIGLYLNAEGGMDAQALFAKYEYLISQLNTGR